MTRLIIKPFGRDLKSFEVLDKALSKHFTEGNCLGSITILERDGSNLSVLRFSNIWFERVWNTQNFRMLF
jgi:glucose-6-phosphate 1-dehydrogenase